MPSATSPYVSSDTAHAVDFGAELAVVHMHRFKFTNSRWQLLAISFDIACDARGSCDFRLSRAGLNLESRQVALQRVRQLSTSHRLGEDRLTGSVCLGLNFPLMIKKA